MNTITLGVRNAFRNLIRSASIVLILGLSIGLSLVMLIANQAVSQKINEVKGSIGNTINIQPAGFSSFSSVNNGLTTNQLNSVSTLSHVVHVAEGLTDRVATNGSDSFDAEASTTNLTSPVNLNSNRLMIRTLSGRLPAGFSLPIQVYGTTDPSHLVSGVNLHVVSGDGLDGTKDSSQALISTGMASKNNLHAGSVFQAYNTALTVAGLFDSGTQGGDNTIILSLPTLQRLSNQPTGVTNAQVTVDSLDNLVSTTTAIKNTLGSAADVQNSQDEANNALQPLQNILSISVYSLGGAVIAGGVIILLTMIMIVRERRREIGILKAIGASNLRVIAQFTSEALTFTILGAIIGLIIGVVGGNPVTKVLVSSSVNTASTMTGVPGTKLTGGFGSGFARRSGLNLAGTNIRNINAQVGWNVLAYGFGGTLLIAIAGSASAGWLIARVRPSEVMRVE